jgi:hypothetical protein
MIERARFSSLRDALKAADYGILYAYATASFDDGWISQGGLSHLEWYERLVLVDPIDSQGFLQESGATASNTLVAVGHGFVIFRATDPTECRQSIERVRPWVKANLDAFVKRGVVDPKRFKFPSLTQ